MVWMWVLACGGGSELEIGPDEVVIPDLTLRDQNDDPVELRSLAADPLVLEFATLWASRTFDETVGAELVEERGDEGLRYAVFLMQDAVSMPADVEDAWAFASHFAIPTVLWAPDPSQAVDLFRTWPEFWLVDERGVLLESEVTEGANPIEMVDRYYAEQAAER
ncbi:MAG: hypothetical protein AAF211_32590 [Myxococcota bacterium]